MQHNTRNNVLKSRNLIISAGIRLVGLALLANSRPKYIHHSSMEFFNHWYHQFYVRILFILLLWLILGNTGFLLKLNSLQQFIWWIPWFYFDKISDRMCYGRLVRYYCRLHMCNGRLLRCYGRLLRCNGRLLRCYGRLLRCYGCFLRCCGRLLSRYGRLLRFYGRLLRCYGRYFGVLVSC